MYFDVLARSYALWFAASLAIWGIVGAGIYVLLNFISRKKKEKEITEILIAELKKAEAQAVKELKSETTPEKKTPHDEELRAALEQELKAIYEAEIKASREAEDIEDVKEKEPEKDPEEKLKVYEIKEEKEVEEKTPAFQHIEPEKIEDTASWQEVDDIYKKAFKL